MMDVFSGLQLGAVTLVAGGILYFLSCYVHNVISLKAFPGPTPLPIVGNFYTKEAVMYLTRFIINCGKKYGKIFTFYAGNSAMVVLMETEAVRQVLTDTKTFIKGNDYTGKFAIIFGDGLVTSNGETHKHDRSTLGRFFIRNNLDKHLQMICKHTRQMMREVLDQGAVEGAPGKTQNMEEYFHVVTLRCFGEFAMSIDYSKPEYKKISDFINVAVSDYSHVIGAHIMYGLPMTNLIPGVRRTNQNRRDFDKHLNELIDARIADRAAGKTVPDDSITAMLDDNQDRVHMLHQLRTLVSAGHDTTAFFGCYFAYLLAKNQHVQDKVKKEVAEVLGDRDQLTNEDIDKLVYCRQVMQETLRIYSVIPYVNRTASKDTPLKEGGNGPTRIIPKGTTVLVPISIMNRDPDVWPNPSEFKPERFEGITGHTVAKMNYLPFGYGSRTCIGNNLALVEGTVMIALLMQRYRFHEDPAFKLKLVSGISLVSGNGVFVRLEKEPNQKP